MVILTSSVKSAIDYIIASKNFVTPPLVHVSSGSEHADGLASKNASVTIIGNEETYNIFVKYFPENIENANVKVFKSMFETEYRFYDNIYPEVLKFQQDKGVKDIFDNVPQHYKVDVDWNGIPAIILDNIKVAGYTLRDIKTTASHEHISLMMKTFAKLHGTFFAMKDQKPDLYEYISDGITDTVTQKLRDVGFEEVTVALINDLVKSLNEDVDSITIDKCKKFANNFMEFISSIPEFVDEYSVICHSDCWSNNMMFLYDKKSGVPIDMKLLDWQVQRITPPGLEAAHCFYGVAGKKALDNFEYYRSLYYDTLCDHITKLGSDPKILYPKEVFLDQWRRFAKLGLIIAFPTHRVAFISKDDITDLVDNKEGKMPMFPTNFKEKEQYHQIMRDLVEHFVRNGFL